MKNEKNTVKFSVNGMHCKSCEMLIKDEISDIPGVETVSVDHKTGDGYLTAFQEIDRNLILFSTSPLYPAFVIAFRIKFLSIS